MKVNVFTHSNIYWPSTLCIVLDAKDITVNKKKQNYGSHETYISLHEAELANQIY